MSEKTHIWSANYTTRLNKYPFNEIVGKNG